METVGNHHPSALSGSVIMLCKWIKADGFCNMIFVCKFELLIHGFTCKTIKMSVYVRCEARQEAPVHKFCESVLLKQRQVSNKVNFLLICVSEKLHFSVKMFRKYRSCKKMCPLCILGTMRRINWSSSVIMFISPTFSSCLSNIKTREKKRY